LRVTLAAKDKVYFDVPKTYHNNTLAILAQGSAVFLRESELLVTVTFDDPKASLQPFMDLEATTNLRGRRVECGYYSTMAPVISN
jgi:hypothetical protein